MNPSNTRNYWHEQEVNSTNKPNKLPSNNNGQVSHSYGDGLQYFDGGNGNSSSLKRNYSELGQQGSPFKKRQFSQQITPPPTSSADHTDDEDDDDDEEGDSVNAHPTGKGTTNKRDDSRRRAAHTAAEQKRRNAIRKGYDTLQSLVPNSHLLDPISSQKVSKAAILKRSTDYLSQINHEKEQLNEQLEAKKKETFCLRAVQKTYEDILEMNINSRRNASATIDDEHKFQVFQNIADTLFHSFDQAMQSSQAVDFPQFTSNMLRWVEDSCRPTDINEIIRRVIEGFKP